MTSSSAGAIVGLGEILWDCHDNRSDPGGAPFNFAYHAALLGAKAAIISRVGNDAAGHELCHLVQSLRMINGIQIDPELATGRVEVTDNEFGQPRYEIVARWPGIIWQ